MCSFSLGSSPPESELFGWSQMDVFQNLYVIQNQIYEAMSYYQFYLTIQVLCKMTDLYFSDDQPFATKP